MKAITVSSHPPHPSELNRHTPTDLMRQLDLILQVAFTIEFVALSEYLEVVLPLLYAIYVSLLTKLPNRVFHAELEGITDDELASSISTILLYVLVEIASFVLLAVLLRRAVRLGAFHVVAFVLETQMTFVQGMMAMSMLISQQVQVEHGGKMLSQLAEPRLPNS